MPFPLALCANSAITDPGVLHFWTSDTKLLNPLAKLSMLDSSLPLLDECLAAATIDYDMLHTGAHVEHQKMPALLADSRN